MLIISAIRCFKDGSRYRHTPKSNRAASEDAALLDSNRTKLYFCRLREEFGKGLRLVRDGERALARRVDHLIEWQAQCERDGGVDGRDFDLVLDHFAALLVRLTIHLA